MSDDTPTVSTEENERNTLLLNSLTDLVPHAWLTVDIVRKLKADGDESTLIVAGVIEGYGRLISILGIAIEYDDAQPPMTLHERLSAAYHELTNTDPAAETDIIRLQEEEEDDNDTD